MLSRWSTSKPKRAGTFFAPSKLSCVVYQTFNIICINVCDHIKGLETAASRADSAMLLVLRPLIIYEGKLQELLGAREPNQNSVTKCASPFSFRTKKIRARACERSSSQRHMPITPNQTLHGALRITPCKQMCCWTLQGKKHANKNVTA